MAEQETVILEIMPVLRRTLGDRLSLPLARFISAPLAGASPRRKRLCQSGRDRPVSADVSGHVLVDKVVEHQEVRKGVMLFRMDTEPFDIALKQAKARLASARQTIGTLVKFRGWRGVTREPVPVIGIPRKQAPAERMKHEAADFAR